MVLLIPKDTPPEQVRKMVDEFEAKKQERHKARKKSSMRDHYGRLKGVFGDPIAYQKMMRGE